jgi:hypothetical protein
MYYYTLILFNKNRVLLTRTPSGGALEAVVANLKNIKTLIK